MDKGNHSVYSSYPCSKIQEESYRRWNIWKSKRDFYKVRGITWS